MDRELQLKILGDYEKVKSIAGTIEPGIEISENGWRFTAEFLWVLHANGVLDDNLKQLYRQVYDQGKVLGLNGIYNKAPRDHLGKQNSPDNFLGMALAFSLIDEGSARATIQYGKKMWPPYTYNNVNPGAYTGSAFFGRRPWDIITMKDAAGMHINWFERLIWSAAIYVSSFSEEGEQDAWALPWMMIRSRKKLNFIERFVCKHWTKRFKNAWPYGIGQLLHRYFDGKTVWRVEDVRHPSAKWLWNEFGEL